MDLLEELRGSQLEGLILEGFVCRGEPVTDTNVLFLRATGVWHRISLDSGSLFHRQISEEPKPLRPIHPPSPMPLPKTSRLPGQSQSRSKQNRLKLT